MAVNGDTIIDIPLLKTIDWLAERKFLQSNWRAKNKALQLKGSELAQSLPGELVSECQRGTGFLAVKKLRDRLVSGAAKNFLGQFKGDAGVWDKLVRAYEVENIQIGEIALGLIRNGEYEIPFLQSQIAKQQQQLIDHEKREADYAKMALNAQRNHIQDCKHLGIKGNDITAELQKLTEQLPGLLFKAVNLLKANHLRESIRYYIQFVAYISQQNDLEGRDLLPTISEIQGCDLKPSKLQETQEQTEATQEAEHIDENLPEEVDWDIQLEDSHDEQGDDIDWDIAAIDDTPKELKVKANGGEKPQEGDVLSRLAADAGYRSAALIELSELTAFLNQRCSELASTAHSSLTTGLPPALQQVNLSSLQEMAGHVAECQTALASDKIKMLLALRSSTNYFNRTSAALSQQGSQESKFYRLQRETQAKRQDLQAKLVEDASKLSDIIAETRVYKIFVEDQISELIKGCKVNITGEINNTLLRQ